MAETGIDGVMAAKPVFADRPRVEAWLRALEAAVAGMDRAAAERVFEEAIPEFRRRAAEHRASAASPARGRNRWNPSQARERCGARDERAGKALISLARGPAARQGGLDQARAGPGSKPGLRPRPCRMAAIISGTVERLRIGDDQRPPQRRGRAQHRVDGRDKVVDGQQRAPRREAAERQRAVASARGREAPPCCP